MGTVKLTPELMAQAMAEVDWDKIDAMTDEDIEQQIADNPEAAPFLNEKQQIGGMIQMIRRKLKMSQKTFAESFHLSIHALRDWEQGRRKPEQGTLNYLYVIRDNPDIVLRTIKHAA